ncbi:MAG: sialidase family protein [Vicinamibacterales bacterium]|jgi:hypothetical protein
MMPRLKIPFLIAAIALLPLTPSAQGGDVVLAIEGRTNQTPWVASEGSFIAVAWGARTPGGATDVYVAVSRDAGVTFAKPVAVAGTAGEARLGGEMPPRVALARQPRGADPLIVVLWTARADGRTSIRSARSTDGGRTFTPSTTLSSPSAAGDRGWPALTVDAAGTPHAIWLDHRGLAEAAGAGEHSGHGQSASTPVQRDGVATAQKSALYYAQAGGPGERELTKGVCYCCKTALAAGTGGSLFAAWRHVYAGNIRDIAFMQSRDGGKTFSAAARISEDGWQLDGCPDDGPAMAVDRNNVVHIVWPTVIGGDNPEGALFYASTKDGRRFTPRRRIPTLGGPSRRIHRSRSTARARSTSPGMKSATAFAAPRSDR